MSTATTLRRIALTCAVALTATLSTAPMAGALESWSKDLTCTSSTGYSVLIQSTAKGSVRHEAGAYYRTVGTTKTAVYRFSNTGQGGTKVAWVWAHDTTISGASVSGSISSHGAKCGTSSTKQW